jgi:hypothetical protein
MHMYQGCEALYYNNSNNNHNNNNVVVVVVVVVVLVVVRKDIVFSRINSCFVLLVVSKHIDSSSSNY